MPAPLTERLLRAVAIAAGVGGTLFWLGSLVRWSFIPTDRRGSLELMGVVMSTVFFIILALPTLVLGLRRRWLVFAALLGLVTVALATDVLFPWLPWGALH